MFKQFLHGTDFTPFIEKMFQAMIFLSEPTLQGFLKFLMQVQVSSHNYGYM